MGALMFLPLIGQFFKSFGGILLILVVVLGIVFLMRGGCSRDPRMRSEEVKVAEVVSGNSFHTEATRRRGRGGKLVSLVDIAVPGSGDELGEQSREYLKALIGGKTVKIEVAGRRTLRNTHLTGVVTSPEGWNINTAMLQQGMAWCTNDQRKDWLVLQEIAKREKKGVWNGYKDDYPEEEYLAGLEENCLFADAPEIEDEGVVGLVLDSLSTGSWRWWLVIVAMFVAASFALSYNSVFAASMIVAIVTGVMILLGDLGTYLSVLLDFKTLGLVLAGYMVGALIYGGLRWVLYVRDRIIRYGRFKAAWFKSQNLEYTGVEMLIPPTYTEAWDAYVSRSEWVKLQTTGGWTLCVVPYPWDCRDYFELWMALWPISAAGFLIQFLFKWAWNGLFAELSALLQKFTPTLGNQTVASK
jgi:endonuclease YncB( thermonuclease family)